MTSSEYIFLLKQTTQHWDDAGEQCGQETTLLRPTLYTSSFNDASATDNSSLFPSKSRHCYGVDWGWLFVLIVKGHSFLERGEYAFGVEH